MQVEHKSGKLLTSLIFKIKDQQNLLVLFACLYVSENQWVYKTFRASTI